MRSPLRYPGGKSKALKYILPMVPEFKIYREPFLGGGSVFLNIKEKHPHRMYWINDIYKPLINFWMATKLDKRNLVEQIKSLKNTFETERELFEYCRKQKYISPTTFFILNRLTFSGTIEAGNYSSKTERFTDSSIERISKLGDILDNVSITMFDYSLLLDLKGEDVFIYMDPPYFKSQKLYGKNGQIHEQFDHDIFFENVRACSHKWLVTYDDCEEVREAFKDYNVKEYSLQYGMNNRLGRELLIYNYEL